MLNQAIDIKRIVQLFAVAVLMLVAVYANAQAPSPRGLNDDQVQRMLDNERWTFGRENMRSNRKNNGSNRSGNRNNGGADGSTSNRDTRSDRNTNGDGDYYWDERSTDGDGNRNRADIDPNDIRDFNDGMEDNPGSTEDSYSPPPPSSNPYQPKPPSAPTDSTAVIGALKYVLIGLGVLLLVYIILQARGTGVFKGKKAKVQEDSEYVEFEEDIHEIEFVDEIELAVRNGDFRKAIRLRFLNVLKDLSDVSLIRWKINKTNYDYIGELSGHKVQKGFMNLTTVYEYCWYGEFNISEGLYHKVAAEFNQFNADMNEVAKG